MATAQSILSVDTFRQAKVIAGRIPELDGVRGMAILLVIVWHYFATTVQTRPGSFAAYGMKMFSLTWAGVDLFFVLSGFLIAGILLDNRSAPNYFRAFYARRFCRIFPLYYLMFGLFALAVAAGWAAKGRGFYWLFGGSFPLWTYATCLQNFAMASSGDMGPNWMGPTWSLAIEEQFYIVLPLLVRFVPARALPWLLAVLVLCAPVLRGVLFLWHPHAGVPGYVLLPARWDALFLGALGAYAMRRDDARVWLAACTKWIRVCVVVCVFATLGLLAKSQGIASEGMSFFGHTVLAVMSLGLILLATLSTEGLTRILFRNSFLVWVGTVSYGVYLFHQPVSGLLHAMILSQPPRIANTLDAFVTVMALAITLCMASLSWQYFERPIVRYGQRFLYEGFARGIKKCDEYRTLKTANA